MRYIIFLFCFINYTNAQDTLNTYYDINWVEVTKEKAIYYRIATKSKNKLWKVIDYYQNGQIQMVGYFKSKKLTTKDGHFIYYYPNGLKSSEGDYKNNQFIGEWVWYFDNGQLSSKELYSKKKLIDIQCWNENGEKQEENCKVEMLPEFIGGQEGLIKYLIESIIYPFEARGTNIKGIVDVKFAIEKDGSVADVKIISSIHPLLDNEALRVINKMPNWIPGKSHNRTVKVYFVLPVKFKLE